MFVSLDVRITALERATRAFSHARLGDGLHKKLGQSSNRLRANPSLPFSLEWGPRHTRCFVIVLR
jgi:hypothetical protein